MSESALAAKMSGLTEYQVKQITAQVKEYLQLNRDLQDTTPQVCPFCEEHGSFIKKGFSGRK